MRPGQGLECSSDGGHCTRTRCSDSSSGRSARNAASAVSFGTAPDRAGQAAVSAFGSSNGVPSSAMARR